MSPLKTVHTHTSPVNRQSAWLHVAIIALVGVVVYLNSFSVPFVLDDHYSLNAIGQKNLVEHLLRGTVRRVTDISFALNYQVHGLTVVGYHITNLTIHLLAAIILYFLVNIVISALRTSCPKASANNERTLGEIFIPFAVAILFVCHPIQTQAVTYIIQRYTSLSAMFYLLALFFYLKARLATSKVKFWLYVVGAVVAAILALFSKQIAVTLPLMLILIELFIFRGQLLKKRFFILCGVLAVILTAVAIVKWQDRGIADFLFDLRHATSEDLYTSRTHYFLTQTRVVVTYISLLCLPVGQSLVHDATIYTSPAALPVMASIALHLALVSISLFLFVKSSRNLSSDDCCPAIYQRITAFGICWFYCAMIVESSIFPIRDVIFEHRVYLPSAGFFMSITAILSWFLDSRKINVRVLWGVLAFICVAFGSMTIARNNVWQKPLLLWQEAALKSPNKWLAQANLAGEYMDHKMPEKALPLFVRAMELNPNLFLMTKVYLGESMKAMKIYEGRFTTGQEFVLPGGAYGSGELDYSRMSRWDSVISNNMGLAYEYLNEPQKAIRSYWVAVTADPGYDLAWYNFALLSAKLGDKTKAVLAADRVRILNPELARNLEILVKN